MGPDVVWTDTLNASVHVAQAATKSTKIANFIMRGALTSGGLPRIWEKIRFNIFSPFLSVAAC